MEEGQYSKRISERKAKMGEPGRELGQRGEVAGEDSTGGNEGTKEDKATRRQTEAEYKGEEFGQRGTGSLPEGERQEPEREQDQEGEDQDRDPPRMPKHRMRAPFGEVVLLLGNVNSTDKCKCEDALRALCANIRPGSAAPAQLPGTGTPSAPAPQPAG